MDSLGQCLASDFETMFSRNRPGHLIFQTVLELDFMEEALELPKAQILHLKPVDIEAGTVPAKDFAATDKKQPPSVVMDQQNFCRRGQSESQETIRVSVNLLDKLMNLAGELVLGRNALKQRLERTGREDPRLQSVMQGVELISSEVKEHIMRMRMQPIGNILGRFKRLVRDLSHQVKKKVTLTVKGGEVELDKSILEGLSDPMTHLIRNCIDHGIETPEEREAMGKPPVGAIQLRAFHEAGQVNIVISDDGRGIDLDKVVKKALKMGILSDEAVNGLSRKEQLNLICLPGFSTAETVTDLSGRGVGMDVVRTNIEKLGGHLEIDTVIGKSTAIRLRLPLTLAIIPCLMVRSADQRYAIPQINLVELVGIPVGDVYHRIEKIGDTDVLRLRERLLPLVRLADVLGLGREFVHPHSGHEQEERRLRIADRRQEKSAGKDGAPVSGADDPRRFSGTDRRRRRQGDIYVVVLRLGMHHFGLLVDELYDMEEVVVKSLSRHIKECKCFAGATIMGDGRVSMILDAAGIAEFTRLRFNEVGSEEDRRLEEKEKRRRISAPEKQAIILFNNHPDEYFAVPLSQVARLEMIDARRIQKVGHKEYLPYKGQGLPLIRLENLLPVKPVPVNTRELFMIIPKTDGGSAGIVASRILDFFETETKINTAVKTPNGIEGSGVVGERLTLFLNIETVMASLKRFDLDVGGAA